MHEKASLKMEIRPSTWQGTKSRWKSARGASLPTSDIWTAPPYPTSVHAKPLKSRQFPAFRTERQNLARSVHLQLPDGPAAHERIEQEEVMFDKTFLPSRGLRAVSRAALGITLVVLSGRAFSAQDKYTLRVP